MNSPGTPCNQSGLRKSTSESHVPQIGHDPTVASLGTAGTVLFDPEDKTLRLSERIRGGNAGHSHYSFRSLLIRSLTGSGKIARLIVSGTFAAAARARYRI